LACKADMYACSFIAIETMLVALIDPFMVFKNEPENCHTLNEVVQALGINFKSQKGAKKILALKLG
jgi:hypothetical protein